MPIFRYGGFGVEGSFGGTQPADFYEDITGASLDIPSDPNIHYDGGLGRARRTVRPGFYSPAGNIEFGANVDTIAHYLQWALGGYAFTDGGKGLNKHEV